MPEIPERLENPLFGINVKRYVLLSHKVFKLSPFDDVNISVVKHPT